MAFPILPVAVAAGAVVWAWWLGKNSNSKQSFLELEDEIVEATVELLPYKEGDPSTSRKPDILAKIAKAINESGATGPDDLDKVMKRLAPDDQPRATITLLAVEFLHWLEQNKEDEYSALALPYHSDAGSRSSAVALIEPDDIYASVREWSKTKQRAQKAALPDNIVRKCGCKTKKGGSKRMYETQKLADIMVMFWREKHPSRRPQESYECPEGKGWHLRTIHRR